MKFVVRVAIDNFNAYDRIFKTIIMMSIPVAAFMLFEQLSGGFNVFSLLGGVSEMSGIRNGRLRAQGAFSHAILAGTFVASLLPIAWGLRARGYRTIAGIGMITSLTITIASSSSGPIMTFLFGLIDIFMAFKESYKRYNKSISYISCIFTADYKRFCMVSYY